MFHQLLEVTSMLAMGPKKCSAKRVTIRRKLVMICIKKEMIEKHEKE